MRVDARGTRSASSQLTQRSMPSPVLADTGIMRGTGKTIDRFSRIARNHAES
jgi:hypothetical protein